ncbi:MAG: Large-conductance mechanosensitive channel [Pseudomonadota bacterium]|jgi:large conductance mechanosensitive channel
MRFIEEFKAFALKGNVVDLAVGVIIGGAFSKIVESLVGDLIMPLISRGFGGLDFSSYYFPLAGQALGLSVVEAKKLGAVFAYGSFLTVALNFVILALVIFIAVRQMNSLLLRNAPTPEPEAPAVSEEVQLLREIRDALKPQ